MSGGAALPGNPSKIHMKTQPTLPVDQAVRKEKRTLLRRLELWLETPMVILGFVWLALLALELTDRSSAALEALGTTIWIIFILDFAVRLTLAPEKLRYVRRNWLTAISLVVPALRVFRFARLFRILRFGRAARGLRLFRILSSLNRGMRALGLAMGRRGFGYAVALTVIVVLAGAAGMYAFERDNADGRALQSYPAALWWTAMMVTTVGSEYWPQSVEGRVLCLLLALYAFAVFGYVAGTLSSFFIERDAASGTAEVPGAKSIADLREEVGRLRADVRVLLERTAGTELRRE